MNDPRKLAPSAMEQLMSYSWPGKVRALENVGESALIRSRGQKDESPLQFEPLIHSQPKPNEPSSFSGDMSTPKLEEAITKCNLHALKVSKGKIQGHGGAAETLGINPNTLRSKMKKLGIPFHHH